MPPLFRLSPWLSGEANKETHHLSEGQRSERPRDIKTINIKDLMAEREGFEPPVELPPRRISSAVHSTTLPPLREMRWAAQAAGRHGAAYGINGGASQPGGLSR